MVRRAILFSFSRSPSTHLKNNMVTITYDTCKVPKKSGEEWVLGYDIETVSANGVRRAITFLDRWDSRRILELGSIQFCSLECKNDYIKKKSALRSQPS